MIPTSPVAKWNGYSHRHGSDRVAIQSCAALKIGLAMRTQMLNIAVLKLGSPIVPSA